MFKLFLFELEKECYILLHVSSQVVHSNILFKFGAGVALLTCLTTLIFFIQNC
jgi:hypothetical protein